MTELFDRDPANPYEIALTLAGHHPGETWAEAWRRLVVESMEEARRGLEGYPRRGLRTFTPEERIRSAIACARGYLELLERETKTGPTAPPQALVSTPKRPTAPRRRKGVVPSPPTRERCRKRMDPEAEAWLRRQLDGLDGPRP